MTTVTSTPGMVSHFSPPEERNDLANVQSLDGMNVEDGASGDECPLMNGSTNETQCGHGDPTLVAIGLRPVMKLALSVGSSSAERKRVQWDMGVNVYGSANVIG